jgi:hypothetical protein
MREGVSTNPRRPENSTLDNRDPVLLGFGSLVVSFRFFASPSLPRQREALAYAIRVSILLTETALQVRPPALRWMP